MYKDNGNDITFKNKSFITIESIQHLKPNITKISAENCKLQEFALKQLALRIKRQYSHVKRKAMTVDFHSHTNVQEEKKTQKDQTQTVQPHPKKQLQVSQSKVKDKSALLQPNLPQLNLKILKLTNCNIMDIQVKDISQMYSLIELNLQSNHITDKGICHLQGLAHLKYLNLQKNQVGDEGLFHLAKLPKLKKFQLTLDKRSFGIQGIKCLKKFTMLRELNIYKYNIRSFEMDKVNRCLYKCEVDIIEDRKAYYPY